jgi:hypothetical protein
MVIMSEFYMFCIFFVACFIFGLTWGYIVFAMRERRLLDRIYKAWISGEKTIGREGMKIHEQYEEVRGRKVK